MAGWQVSSSLAVWLVVAAGTAVAGEAPIIDAAARQDLAAVRALVSRRVDVNAAQADGATALHWAVHWDDLPMADLLLRAGARPGVANRLEATPLSLACDSASAAMVERLVRAGADVNERPSRRPAPLLLCARRGDAAAVRALLAARARVDAAEPLRGQTALMWAAARGHAAVVKQLLAAGADVRARSQPTRLVINRADPNDIYTAVIGEVVLGRSTPLLFAAAHGELECARILIEAGAAIDEVTADGLSALVLAVHGGHPALAAWLLSRGANPNAATAGYVALHAAVLRGDLASATRLLDAGADINARIAHGTQTVRAGGGFVLPENLTGATPFVLAAKFLERELLTLLATRGADTRLTLADGTTALMLASGLFSPGPLIDRRGRVSVFNVADEPAALETAQEILKLGGVVNAINTRGESALHGAAARGYATVVRLLIDAGARLDARNAKGDKPFDVAAGAVKDLLSSPQ